MAEPSFRDDRTRQRDDAETRRARELDAGLQPDPELAEGRAQSGMGWLIAICVAILFAAVFYGLNYSGSERAGTSAPIQTSQTPNSRPGTTTGTATSRPPQSESAGSESDRAAKPADGSGNPAATPNKK